MSYRHTATIYLANGWQLDSYGNGAAYELTDTNTLVNVWLDGDDATEFRADFDRAETDHAICNLFDGYRGVMQL